MNTLKLVGIRGGGRICAVSALMLSCAWAARASVFDDAKFKLDIRGDADGNNYIDAGEVGNALDFSAASPSYAFYGEKGVAKPYTCDFYPSQTVMRVALPLAAGDSKDQTCIYFPQEPANKYCGLTIQKAAVTGSKITMYVRFRPDGLTTSPNGVMLNGFNGWGSAGLGLYLDGEYKVGILTPNKSGSSTIKLDKGEWYDAFVVATNSTDGTSTGIDIFVCKNGGSTFSTASVTRTGNEAMVIGAGRAITFGSYESNTPSNPRAFKGAIAEAAIWNRALSKAEMTEVMTGSAPCGGDWQIGAVNSSADEFNDATPADVYDVQSMPWNKMRKSLTAENPSLALSTTMTADDHKRNRTLTFTPILSGTASAPVEVSLNGTVVGEIDLATTTSITLPRKLWRHGSGLSNTIVVTRKAPVAGTVQFDAISLAEGDFGEAGGVLEDATFKLDLRGGESDYEKPGDLGNALDYSAASPLVGYMGDQRGPQIYNKNFLRMPTQETAYVQNPYYPYTTNTQTVLHFYQDFKGADKGSVNSGVVIPGAAPNSLVQTYYLRFRWDGVAPAKTGENSTPAYILQSGQSSNGNNVNNGVAIALNGIEVDGTTTNAVLACRIGASGASRYPQMTETISAGEWVDAFVTFEANADNTGFTTTYTVCTPSPTGSNFDPPQLKKQTVTNNGGLSFDSSNLSLGLYHDSVNTRATTRCFRGLIADFMIWERALTDEEKIEIMAGQHGSKWTIGAANGSADEFTDTDPAAVYEPQTMPWRQMRKTLDASHPTLTIKSPLASYEAGKPVILSVTPILDGTGAEVPVTVSVNGAAAGTLDLAKEHSLIIDRQHWTRDANGNVTVAITRTDTTGSVAIDAITLSGSWQNAADDGGSNGMVNEKYSSGLAFAGDSNVKHFTNSMSVGASHTNYTFGVWIPEGMGEKCGWKFSTKTTSRSNPVDGLDAQHTVYVNGTAVGTHNGWFNANESFTLDIPAGTLHDGMNYVQWVQTLPTRADQQAIDGTPGVYQYYDFWGMTLVPPSKGLMIIIR